MAQIILEFRIDRKKHEVITEIGRKLGIKIIEVSRRDYGQKLGVLAEVAGFKREKKVYSGPELPAEMLVFSGMNSDQLDEFLAQYRESGQPQIGLKAVVTANNVSWDAETLFRELLKEHSMRNFSKT